MKITTTTWSNYKNCFLFKDGDIFSYQLVTGPEFSAIASLKVKITSHSDHLYPGLPGLCTLIKRGSAPLTGVIWIQAPFPMPGKSNLISIWVLCCRTKRKWWDAFYKCQTTAELSIYWDHTEDTRPRTCIPSIPSCWPHPRGTERCGSYTCEDACSF